MKPCLLCKMPGGRFSSGQRLGFDFYLFVELLRIILNIFISTCARLYSKVFLSMVKALGSPNQPFYDINLLIKVLLKNLILPFLTRFFFLFSIMKMQMQTMTIPITVEIVTKIIVRLELLLLPAK